MRQTKTMANDEQKEKGDNTDRWVYALYYWASRFRPNTDCVAKHCRRLGSVSVFGWNHDQ